MISDEFSRQAWETAEYHLAEALVQPENAPGATVHLAYYAMFHASRAVLLRATGAAPKTHSSVIQQFGELARSRSEALRLAGHDLNKVEDRRIIADYSQVKRLSVEDARDALNKAQDFLSICVREFGFPRVGRSGDG